MTADPVSVSESKPFASLASTLLARKGTARPAMRPQNEPRTVAKMHPLEDLGWNDMGDDNSPPAIALSPSPMPSDPVVDRAPDRPEPEIKRQQDVLAQRVAAGRENAMAEPQAAAPVRQPAPAPQPRKPTRPAKRSERAPAKSDSHKDQRRAAFTLRLDAERHLKLRLASTMRNRSAQQIVTEALDKLLAETPELAALARQVGKQ